MVFRLLCLHIERGSPWEIQQLQLLGLTKVSLRVFYWFLYDIIQIYIYTGVEKRIKATEEDQVQEKIKFLSLLKNEIFLRLLH